MEVPGPKPRNLDWHGQKCGPGICILNIQKIPTPSRGKAPIAVWLHTGITWGGACAGGPLKSSQVLLVQKSMEFHWLGWSLVQPGVNGAYDIPRGLASLFPRKVGVLGTARAGNCKWGNYFLITLLVFQRGPCKLDQVTREKQTKVQ